MHIPAPDPLNNSRMLAIQTIRLPTRIPTDNTIEHQDAAAVSYRYHVVVIAIVAYVRAAVNAVYRSSVVVFDCMRRILIFSDIDIN